MTQWNCLVCTFLNHAALPVCEVCETPRAPKKLDATEVLDLTQDTEEFVMPQVADCEATFSLGLRDLSVSEHTELRLFLETGTTGTRVNRKLWTMLMVLGWRERDGQMVMPDDQEICHQTKMARDIVSYSSFAAVQAQKVHAIRASVAQASSTIVTIEGERVHDEHLFKDTHIDTKAVVLSKDLSCHSAHDAKRQRLTEKMICGVFALSGDMLQSSKSPTLVDHLAERLRSHMVRVRLMLPGLTSMRPFSMSLDDKLELIYLFAIPHVQEQLSKILGTRGEASVIQLAEQFVLVKHPDHNHIFYSAWQMQQVRICDALHGGGTFRVEFRGPWLGRHFADVGTGRCEGVKVLRLRKRLGNREMGSPVLLVKNYNGDHGLELMRTFGIKVPAYRNAHRSYVSATVSYPELVSKHAENVIRICMDLPNVISDRMALAALTSRNTYDALGNKWGQPIGLAYPRGSSLHRHVDHHGQWVVLFSFGLTCEFYANGKITIESGDALVFNGSTTHAVWHGLDKVWAQGSYRGDPHTLPGEMLEDLANTRVSIQVRQN